MKEYSEKVSSRPIQPRDMPKQALDEYPMPDSKLTVADLEACGYLYGDLLPLSKEQALSLFKEDLAVFMIKDGVAKMAYKPDEIQEHNGVFAVRRGGWEESREFSTAIEDRMQHQEQREAAFLQSPQDTFAIYQVKGGDELRDIRFEPLDWLESKGVSVDHRNYDLAYTALLTDRGSTGEIIETLWERFNNDHPADYQRPSPSVSDIIALKHNGVVSCHYVDSFGFKEISTFLKSSEESFLGYCFFPNETYSNPVHLKDIDAVKQYISLQVPLQHRVKICDMDDCCVFESLNGKIIFPNEQMISPNVSGHEQGEPSSLLDKLESAHHDAAERNTRTRAQTNRLKGADRGI
jgi:hypothetical protein